MMIRSSSCFRTWKDTNVWNSAGTTTGPTMKITAT
jgi:hypothetical protein